MKKKCLSALLCLALCLSLLPAALAVGENSARTYDEAVAVLQSADGYETEQTFDTDYGTIFMYNHGPNPHGQHGFLALVTKAPCAKGEGAILGLPHPRNSLFCLAKPPHAMELSGDGRSFTYSYLYNEPVVSGEGKLLRPAGDFRYSLDLTTGEITESYAPLGYERALAALTQAEGYVVDELLETPAATVVLRHKEKPADSGTGDPAFRDYTLHLVFRDDNVDEPFLRLLLPSTICLSYAYAPTDRAPDSIAVSSDGKVLTYVYRFEDKLVNSRYDNILHEAGTYTYVVDPATGELSVTHSDEVSSPALPAETTQPTEPQQPAAPGQDGFADVPATAWFAPYVATVREKGVMIGTGADTFSPEAKLSQAECLTLAFRLYDLMRGEEHVIEKAPEKDKLTLTLADGTVLEGYGPGHGEVDCVFGWWFSPMGTRQAIYAMVPGWPGWSVWSEENARAGLEAQEAWLNDHPEVRAHGVPAAITLNGVTYQGTTDCFMPVQPFAFKFDPERERAEEVNSILYEAVHRKADPVPWWQDTAYTITQRGLEDIFDPADFTNDPASRGFFARLIASACEGHLDKLNRVEAIPDLPREKDNTTADAYREAAYALYEAGILTGVDQAGTFAADATLTRAEAATMVARSMDVSLRIQSTPQAASAYDEALADLRLGFGYHNERLFDTDICTVVVRDYGGMMHAQKGVISILYKPGSAQGDGFTLNPPHPGNDYSPLLSRNPDGMELSEDEKMFTYSYHYDEPLFYLGQMIRAAGDFIYTVDLTTGEVSENVPTVPEEDNTYAASLDRLLNETYPEKGYVVEQTIEAPLCTLIFCRFPVEDGIHSYFLDLVYKTDVLEGDHFIAEGSVIFVALPITRDNGSGQPGDPVLSSGQMPDSMELSEDGNTFTLTYNECHYGSPYTQVIDLRTGIYEGK